MGETVPENPVGLESFLLMPAEEQVSVLGTLSLKDAAGLLREADSRSVKPAIELLGLARAAPILREIPPDDLADLVIRFETAKREEILAAVGEPVAGEVKKLLEYPADSAGGIMNPRYASVPAVVTVGRALEMLREAARAEAINYVYVVDATGKLAGTVPVRAILVSPPGQKIQEIADRRIVHLNVHATRGEVVRAFRDNHFLALPVVDDHQRLVGVVTADDVLSAAREEHEELLYSATGVDAREPAMHTISAAKSRVPWISVTVLGGLGCAAVAGFFQHTLERLVILGVFLPLVLGLAEAVAAQTTSLVMRALVTGQVTKVRRFLLREVMIGLILGVYAGSIVGSLSWLWHSTWTIGLMIGGSIALSITWATLLSVAVPTVLRRLKIEPTVASGPVVLTIADISTLVIYFIGAVLFL